MVGEFISFGRMFGYRCVGRESLIAGDMLKPGLSCDSFEHGVEVGMILLEGERESSFHKFLIKFGT